MDVRRLLVGIDFRSPSLQAARWAAALAGPDATIELAHVQPRHVAAHAAAAEAEAHRRLLAGLSGFASTLGAAPDGLHVRSGDPAEELCTLAENRGAGVLVLGRNLEGGDDGRTRERLLRRCTVPVLVVGSSSPPPAGRVLAALDDGTSDAVLVAAAAIARRRDAALVAVHVEPAAEDGAAATAATHERLRARLSSALGAEAPAAHLVIRTGDAAEELLAYLRQEPADLLVIGTNARPSDDLETLGRTTRLLARLAPVPVLVVPHSGGRARPRSLNGRAARARGEPPSGPLPAA
jgi:nucleotide-binding universal stress UspA family protein